MKISHIPALLATLLLATVCSGSETKGWPSPLASAISAMTEGGVDYAYTREAWDDLGHYVERFDPSKPRSKQWRLVSFDDQEPAPEHVERYAKEYEGLFNRDHPAKISLADLVDVETLTVKETTPTQIIYGFKPLAEDSEDAKIMAHLSGTLFLDLSQNIVTEIQLVNNKKFSPAAMVSIKEFSLSMRFGLVSERGLISLVQSQTKIRGRFMGLKKIEQSQTVEFRDFASTSAP